jgi:PEP-CTERM motif
MNTRRLLNVNKKFQRWMSAAALLTGSAFASNASAVEPAFSGTFNQMYTTSTTDSSNNTEYYLDFHMTGAGLPIQLSNLPAGSSGIANGSGGPVSLSELVITDGTNKATYDITGAIQTQFGNPSNNSTWVGAITDGIATLNLSPAKTTPAFASYLSTIENANFTLSYVGAYSASSSVAPALAPSGSVSYNLVSVAAVPEPSSIIPAGIGAAMLGGFLWRRRRASLKSGIGSLAVAPC